MVQGSKPSLGGTDNIPRMYILDISIPQKTVDKFERAHQNLFRKTKFSKSLKGYHNAPLEAMSNPFWIDVLLSQNLHLALLS